MDRWITATHVLSAVVAGFVLPAAAAAQGASADAEVTFTRDIAPILRRSCEACHRPGGAGPMSLQTYEEVRPWARAIKTRTGLGPRMGVMPPWYVEKDIGIQSFKDDPSLSAEEVRKIAAWVDNGAPQGDQAHMPPPIAWDDSQWRIGTPDLVVRTSDVVVKANSPDWWGEIPSIPIPLDEDRFVVAVEVREVNDVPVDRGGRQTVGGRWVFHHLIWSTRVMDAPANEATSWPVHEVGRNPDIFDPNGARLLKARSHIVSDSAHLHSNGRDTTAYLEIGFKFAPKGFQPKYKRSTVALASGVDIDVRAMDANQELHAYAYAHENVKIMSFEPHLHAPGKRMCLELIWGMTIQTLNCVGYDHNWVRGYHYTDDSAPLVPKGAILHIVGYMDNSPSNPNIPDPRNWQGAGNRSVANMFIDLGNRVALTDEQFREEMEKRVAANPKRDVFAGCPLCAVVAREQRSRPVTATQGQQQGQQQ